MTINLVEPLATCADPTTNRYSFSHGRFWVSILINCQLLILKLAKGGSWRQSMSQHLQRSAAWISTAQTKSPSTDARQPTKTSNFSPPLSDTCGKARLLHRFSTAHQCEPGNWRLQVDHPFTSPCWSKISYTFRTPSSIRLRCVTTLHPKRRGSMCIALGDQIGRFNTSSSLIGTSQWFLFWRSSTTCKCP